MESVLCKFCGENFDGKERYCPYCESLLITESDRKPIETHPDHRRKGLATLLAAYMIEYSLENGLEPRWDAENESSARLAAKLGYSDPEEYKVMIIFEE